MGILRGAKTKLTTKAGLIAAGVVVIGGGAAIAAPGITLSGSEGASDDVVEVASADDDLAAMAEHCEEQPDAPFCKGDSYHGDNVDGFSAWVRSVPSDWGCIRGRLVSHAASQGPHGDHIDDLDFATAEEAAAYLADVRDAPDFLARTCVANVLGGSEPDAEEAVVEDADEDDAEAFSAWVRSVPSDWGCIRGQLVSSVASSGRDAAFDELSFDSAEEAATYLAEYRDDPSFFERRCVEVAIARDGGPADADGVEDEVGDGPGNGRGNAPADGRVGSSNADDGTTGGHGNGRPNGNGQANGKGNGQANGKGNGQANGNGGDADGESNGPADGQGGNGERGNGNAGGQGRGNSNGDR